MSKRVMVSVVSWPGLATLLSLWLLSASAPAAAQIVPLGPAQSLQEPVDSCLHFQPSLAPLANGVTLAGWKWSIPDDLLMRSIAPDGSLGVPTVVFADVLGTIMIDSHPDGGVAALTSRRFDDGGSLVGELWLSHLDETGALMSQTLVSDVGLFWDFDLVTGPDGITVVWQRDTMPGPSADPVVEIRRFSPDLAPRPGMTTLDGYVERYAALAMLPDGRSLVAVNETPDVAGSQIRLQLIDANGAAVGAPVDGPVGRDPQLAAGAGAVALTWFEDSSPAGERVGVQLWDPEAMVPLGAELGVDDAPATGTPKILATADGWLVVWVYNEFNDGGVLSARLLDAAGQPTAPSVELNEPVTTAHGSNARITSPVLELIGSRLVAAWQVYRFTPILPAPCDISFALEVQQFRLDLATSLNEIPALDWRGLLALVALLAVVAWRRLG